MFILYFEDGIYHSVPYIYSVKVNEFKEQLNNLLLCNFEEFSSVLHRVPAYTPRLGIGQTE